MIVIGPVTLLCLFLFACFPAIRKLVALVLLVGFVAMVVTCARIVGP